jgi:hypothetical protein
VFGLAAAGAVSAPIDCEPVDDERRASHRALTWVDFQGTQHIEAGPLEAPVRAKIAVALGLDAWDAQIVATPDGSLVARVGSACVRAFVYKGLSTRRAPNPPADLRHEQGHFDLAQRFVPVLEARLAALAVRVASGAQARDALLPEVQRVYREVALEMREMQTRYERETKCGKRHGAQRRWRRWLAAELGRRRAAQQGDVLAQKARSPG